MNINLVVHCSGLNRSNSTEELIACAGFHAESPNEYQVLDEALGLQTKLLDEALVLFFNQTEIGDELLPSFREPSRTTALATGCSLNERLASQ